ncbi:MAG: glutamine--fructose-6-phosphate transaminase (isomerizing), partial [Candidatus Omnitrophica bacterium]|nr:glutamine--fructose-6-phosphate transaminase (isomerizing) [Candidatus Omnitrophota bacterium]
MCGIVGYVGKKEAVPILMAGLRRLEYRGYDSAGIAVVHENRVFQRKAKGKIQDLAQLIEKKPLPQASVGIAHTRWATHGAPNDINAHPHASCDKKIMVVHNGIIENYMSLKKSLAAQGHRFVSETDTEVLAHLIEKYYKGNLEKAVIRALKDVEGSFALGVVCGDEPGKVVCARQDSPLIVAEGPGGLFIASDVPAILEHCRRVVYLKDKQVAVLCGGEITLFDFNHKKAGIIFSKIAMDAESAQKGGYPHFMLKEIYEQPRVLKKLFSAGRQEMKKLAYPRDTRQIVVVACGTAYHAGLVGKYVIESLARLPVWVDLSSEFRY